MPTLPGPVQGGALTSHQSLRRIPVNLSRLTSVTEAKVGVVTPTLNKLAWIQNPLGIQRVLYYAMKFPRRWGNR